MAVSREHHLPDPSVRVVLRFRLVSHHRAVTVPSFSASETYVILVTSLLIGTAAGMLLARRAPMLLAVVAAGVAGATVVGYVQSDGLRYTNATAALAVQVAALVAIVLTRGRVPRAVIVVALLPAAVVAWLESAWLGGLTWLAVVVAAALPPLSVTTRRVVAFLGWLMVMALPVVQIALVMSDWRPALLVRPLTEVRLVLWSDALGFAAQRPLLGQGPGSFAELNSLHDVNTLYRHAHSAFLEVAAELGLVGLLLLVLLVSAGFLLLARAPGAEALVGILAWSGLWLHAMLDFVADYPQVLLVAGLVVGAAAGRAPSGRHETAPALGSSDHV